MNQGLTQSLRRAQQLRGSSTAVFDEQATYTWNALIDRISRVAAGFRQLGVTPGDRVAILAHNDHRSLEVFFAALWAGAIIAPINSRLSTEEINTLFREIEPKLLVAGPEFTADAESYAVDNILLTQGGEAHNKYPDYEELLSAAKPIIDCGRKGDDIACLFFTGGTTGTPKAVMLSHSNIMANSINFISHIGMDDNTVHLHCGPLYHVAAAVRLFSVTLAAGTHVILPKFDAHEVLRAISEKKVTLATFVPTMLQALLEINRQADYNLSSLEFITYGAAPMPEKLLTEAMHQMPSVNFVQSYGMTETSPIATMLGAAEHRNPKADRLRSAGRAALLTEVNVVSPNGTVLGPNEIGEIVVRGPNVMLGYWQQPEATALALKDGWMHTGDLGYMDGDGYLYVVDRLKDVIITGGENVYSQEVENVIMQHAAVSACAIIGLPDEKWGERVHAVVVPKNGEVLEGEAIIDHCKRYLASYKCPKSVTLRDTPLPLSGANKVLKAQLKQEVLAN